MTNETNEKPFNRATSVDLPTSIVTIESLSLQGEGRVRGDDGRPIFVAGALPDEQVRIGPVTDGRARLVEVLAPSPLRIDAPCRHYHACGGCSLQHLDAGATLSWKRMSLIRALAHRGLAPPVGEVIAIAPGRRRRARLFFRKIQDRVVIGFRERQGQKIVDLASCPALVPSISALLEPLRRLAAGLLKQGEQGEAEVQAVNQMGDRAVKDEGPEALDVVLSAPLVLDLDLSRRLVAFAEETDVARLSWRATGAATSGQRRSGGRGRNARISRAATARPTRPAGSEGAAEQVIQRRPVQARFGDVLVDCPPGAFLQPSAEGQAQLIRLVLDGVADGVDTIDLFAGIGTFTFPLAASRRVAAYESSLPAVEAINIAARRAGMGERVHAERRNLERRPVMAADLSRFKACLFDPPRAGAEAQARQIAESALPIVVGVSCHPPSFARDARILVDGGYRLESVQPVDQFPWTAHLELVGLFRR